MMMWMVVLCVCTQKEGTSAVAMDADGSKRERKRGRRCCYISLLVDDGKKRKKVKGGSWKREKKGRIRSSDLIFYI